LKQQAIGIFGGSFNPIHYGHLRSAIELKERLQLSEVRLVPCYWPPHKTTPVALAQHRLAMVHLAVKDQPELVVDEREFQRSDQPSYTLDTLTHIRAEMGPDISLCLLLGMDALLGLPSWHQWQQLFDYAHLVVIPRPNWTGPDKQSRIGRFIQARMARNRQALLSQASGKLWLQPCTPIAVSASQIRQLISQGKDASHLLPARVWDYIQSHQLYRSA
jgi:nicotinate-nucleotide adenylyltransferase